MPPLNHSLYCREWIESIMLTITSLLDNRFTFQMTLLAFHNNFFLNKTSKFSIIYVGLLFTRRHFLLNHRDTLGCYRGHEVSGRYGGLHRWIWNFSFRNCLCIHWAWRINWPKSDGLLHCRPPTFKRVPWRYVLTPLKTRFCWQTLADRDRRCCESSIRVMSLVGAFPRALTSCNTFRDSLFARCDRFSNNSSSQPLYGLPMSEIKVAEIR